MIKVKLADVVIGIKNDDEKLRNFFKDYLSNEDSSFDIEVSDDDIKKEREYFLKSEGNNIASSDYLRTLVIQRKISNELYKYNAILFHGSCFAINDKAYLLTGKSGAGKSTHARIYREVFENVIMINDDKPFIRLIDKEIKIYGSPWNGKHHLSCNASYPIKAICFINQDLDNHIELISKKEALGKIYSQTYRPNTKEGMIKVISIINEINRNIDTFDMYCNMDKEAAIISYKGMNHE